MKVTSTKTVDFPQFRWGIDAGAERELPEDKEAQEAILAHPAISSVTGKKNEPATEEKKDKNE